MIERTLPEDIQLKKNARIISSILGSIKSGKFTLKETPIMIKTLIEGNIWRRFTIKTGETITYKANEFEKFVSTEPLEGLGVDIKIIKNICRDHVEVLDLIDRVCQRKPGENQEQDSKGRFIPVFDNVQTRAKEPAPTGNTKAAALRRLRKDRPDLHEKVLAGTLSAHRAMICAGFRKQKTPFEITKSNIDNFNRSELLYLKIRIDKSLANMNVQPGR